MHVVKLNQEEPIKLNRLLKEHYLSRGIPLTLQALREYLSLNDKQFFSLEKDKEILGCVSVMLHHGNVAELKDIVVPENRALKSLIEPVLQWCKEQEARKVFTHVPVDLAPFMLELGFQQEGSLKTHYSDNEDLVTMSAFFLRKRERQVNLKDKLESIEIGKKTSEQLRRLPMGR